MKYSTNELSKILNVSTNTIRRYEKMGYLGKERNEENGYRQFNSSDIEKLMYVSKYRKIGFSHEEILELFHKDISFVRNAYKRKMDELDEIILHYQGMRHMLRDDINMLETADKFGTDPFLYTCSSMLYVLYQKRGQLCTKENEDAIDWFMNAFVEFEYLYLFGKKDVIDDNLIYSEGVVVNKLTVRKYSKYNNEICGNVDSYEERECVMQFVKLPLLFWDETLYSQKEIKDILYNPCKRFIKNNGYELDGDVVGIKMGISKEDDKEYQYILMHFPVRKL